MSASGRRGNGDAGPFAELRAGARKHSLAGAGCRRALLLGMLARGDRQPRHLGVAAARQHHPCPAERKVVEAPLTSIPVPAGGIDDRHRIANRLLRRARDYAQVRGNGSIDRATANAALEMLEVDAHGFDELDRRLLRTIIEKYDGGPVGLNTLAAALAEEQDALEEVYEPFLIQIGFLDRTPRGRVATRLAYEHLGIEMPRKHSLF